MQPRAAVFEPEHNGNPKSIGSTTLSAAVSLLLLHDKRSHPDLEPQPGNTEAKRCRVDPESRPDNEPEPQYPCQTCNRIFDKPRARDGHKWHCEQKRKRRSVAAAIVPEPTSIPAKSSGAAFACSPNDVVFVSGGDSHANVPVQSNVSDPQDTVGQRGLEFDRLREEHKAIMLKYHKMRLGTGPNAETIRTADALYHSMWKLRKCTCEYAQIRISSLMSALRSERHKTEVQGGIVQTLKSNVVKAGATIIALKAVLAREKAATRAAQNNLREYVAGVELEKEALNKNIGVDVTSIDGQVVIVQSPVPFIPGKVFSA